MREVADDENHDEAEDILDEEDYMKVRLYFFNSDKSIRDKLFTEEWLIVVKDNLDDPEELQTKAIPFLEVSNRHCCNSDPC